MVFAWLFSRILISTTYPVFSLTIYNGSSHYPLTIMKVVAAIFA
jgi:hypothetical protein